MIVFFVDLSNQTEIFTKETALLVNNFTDVDLSNQTQNFTKEAALLVNNFTDFCTKIILHNIYRVTLWRYLTQYIRDESGLVHATIYSTDTSFSVWKSNRNLFTCHSNIHQHFGRVVLKFLWSCFFSFETKQLEHAINFSTITVIQLRQSKTNGSLEIFNSTNAFYSHNLVLDSLLIQARSNFVDVWLHIYHELLIKMCFLSPIVIWIVYLHEHIICMCIHHWFFLVITLWTPHDQLNLEI